MASMRDLGLRLDDLARYGAIRKHILKLPNLAPDRNLSVTFEGLTEDEIASLIVQSIKIEQERSDGPGVLTPTEYGNRFEGLDLTKAQSDEKR